MFFFVLGHKKYSALLFYFLFLFTGFFLFFYNGKNLEKSFSLLAKEVKKGKKIEEDKKLSKKNILSLSSEEFRLLVASFGKKNPIERKHYGMEVEKEKEIVLKQAIQSALQKVSSLEKKVREESVHSEEEKKKSLVSLTKVFSSIKSPKAAQILSKIDSRTALLLVKGLSPKKIAELMSFLPPEEAAQLTSVLVHSNNRRKS